MSLLQLFTNNAISLLNSSISPFDLELHVLPGTGSQYPQPSNAGEFFLVTLETTAAPFDREIVKVIGRSGDTLFIDPAGRGQEGTVPQAWAATDTLVDHRLTAETIRQAFLNPPQTSGGPSVAVANEGTVLTTAATKINFVGPGVNATATGTEVTVNVTSGSSTGGPINGGSTVTPVQIPSVTTEGVNTANYSQYNRGFKYLVTILMPLNGESGTFEVLANVRGLIGTNESVQWTRTNRVGYNFQGHLNVSLDTLNQTLSLTWDNQEPHEVEVMVTRIQHAP